MQQDPNRQQPCPGGRCLSPLSSFFMAMPQPPDIYAITQLQGYCRTADMAPTVAHLAALQPRLASRFCWTPQGWMEQQQQPEQLDVAERIREVVLSEAASADEGLAAYVSQLMSGPPLGFEDDLLWDITLVHHTCDLQRTDVLLRASHVLGDGHTFVKNLQAVMQPGTAPAQPQQQQQQQAGRQELSPAAKTAPGASGARGKQGEKHGRGKLPAGAAAAAAEGDMSDLIKAVQSGGGAPGSPASSSQQEEQEEEEERQQQQQQQQQSTSGALRHRRGTHACSSAPASSTQQQQDRPGQEAQARGHRKRSLMGRAAHRLAQLVSVMVSWLLVVARFLHKLLAPWTALLYTMLLPVLPSDPVNSVKASPNECVGPRQWLALHLPLPQVHASAKALGHTVNAMAAACLAGGVRRYLDARGEGVPSSIRICSMVDTRAMGAKVTGLTAGASNNFSFIAVPLPTDPATAPAQRVHGAAAALNWIRHSLAVPLAVRIPSLVQAWKRDPQQSAEAIMQLMPYRTTIGFSNMRGPQQPLRLAGFPVARMFNGVQPNAFGAFVSLFSYHEGISFTATSYSNKVDARQLLQHIHEEYRELAGAAAASLSS